MRGAALREHWPIPAERATRSAIREDLLHAVLVLNDGILPQSVDEYIVASETSPEVRQA